MDHASALYVLAHYVAGADGGTSNHERAAIRLRLRSRGLRIDAEDQQGLEARLANGDGVLDEAIGTITAAADRMDALSMAVEVAGVDRFLDGGEVEAIQRLADRLLVR